MTPLKRRIHRTFNALAAAVIAVAPSAHGRDAEEKGAGPAEQGQAATHWHEQPFRKPEIMQAGVNAPYYERPPGARPEYIVMHSTETLSARAALKTLSEDVSAHYLVTRDGAILQLVAEDKAAWHAGGPANWEGSTGNFNMHSIGIEIVNFAHMPYTDAQLAAVKDLVHDIQQRHAIPPHRVLAHSDVNIRGRGDPGPFFPWHEMAKCGIGISPAGVDERLKGDYTVHAPGSAEYGAIRSLMTELGYDRKQPLGLVVMKFNMHYDTRGYNTMFFWRNKPTARVLRLAESLVQQKRLLEIVPASTYISRPMSGLPGLP